MAKKDLLNRLCWAGAQVIALKQRKVTVMQTKRVVVFFVIVLLTDKYKCLNLGLILLQLQYVVYLCNVVYKMSGKKALGLNFIIGLDHDLSMLNFLGVTAHY